VHIPALELLSYFLLIDANETVQDESYSTLHISQRPALNDVPILGRGFSVEGEQQSSCSIPRHFNGIVSIGLESLDVDTTNYVHVVLYDLLVRGCIGFNWCGLMWLLGAGSEKGQVNISGERCTPLDISTCPKPSFHKSLRRMSTSTILP
jgi:hypothetical protein